MLGFRFACRSDESYGRWTPTRIIRSAFTEYDFVVVNDELDNAVDRLRAIVLAERARLPQMTPVAEHIVSTFH